MFRNYLPRVYKTASLLFNGDLTNTLRLHETTFLIRSFCSNKCLSTVSYLIKSCGFSEEKAISLSKKIQLKNSSHPDTVLTLFKHEFPNTDIFKIIEKYPSILLSDANKSLKPKIEFLRSLGFSGPALAKLLLKAPFILHQSLETKLKPSVMFLKGILPKESDIVSMINRSPWLFSFDPQKRLAPNIAVLRSHGVPDRNILKLLMWTPNTLIRIMPDRLSAIAEEAKGLQFDPSKYSFLAVIQGLSGASKSSWEAKSAVYKSWGWSDEDIRIAFRRHPQCMMLSNENIMGSMELLVNKLGYDSLLIAKYPLLLMYSLEKRVMPRLSILRVLISNNLVKKDININTVMQWTDEAFLKKFVTKFEEQLPQLLEAYKGKTNAV